jgi:Rrf2 family protein
MINDDGLVIRHAITFHQLPRCIEFLIDKGDGKGINTIIITFRRDSMLQIARHTDYAARIVLHLACLGEGAQASIAEISEQRMLPAFFVRRLTGTLVKGGILTTTRGAAGGIRLARPASEISLLDLVRVMEGPIALNRCLDADHTCPFGASCPVQTVWAEATRALEAVLAAARFDTLATAPAGHQAAHLQILHPIR